MPLLLMGGLFAGLYLLFVQYSKGTTDILGFLKPQATATTPVAVPATLDMPSHVTTTAQVIATAKPTTQQTPSKKVVNTQVAKAMIRKLDKRALAESFDLRNTVNNVQKDIARQDVTDADLVHLQGLICSTEFCRRNPKNPGCADCFASIVPSSNLAYYY